jgi:anti-sigma regulatory factor (Ser/Thr protein kinase)
MIGSQLPAVTQAGNGTRDAITAPPPATPARAHRSYVELAAVPGAVRYARRYTRHILATWKLSYLTDDAELVVSELITNAVQATPATPHPAPVALYLAADDDRLSVLAWDCSPEPPVHRPHNDDAVSGRGLEIIQALTDRCGTCVTGRAARSSGPGSTWTSVISPRMHGRAMPASASRGKDRPWPLQPQIPSHDGFGAGRRDVASRRAAQARRYPAAERPAAKKSAMTSACGSGPSGMAAPNLAFQNWPARLVHGAT